MFWQQLNAKLSFWYTRRFIRLNREYEFMYDAAKPNAISVKLLKKYDGVIVEYDNIQLDERDQLVFDFDIVANPNMKSTHTKQFINFTKNVMRSILINSIEQAENKYHENGNTDTSESNEERALHEESTSVPESRVSGRSKRKKTVRRNKKVHPKV